MSTNKVVEMQQVDTPKENLSKSELLSREKELIERSDILLKELQEKEYTIKFNDKQVFNNLLKFLEHEAPWDHTTAASLIMLYRNLVEQRNDVNKIKWNGNIMLRSVNVNTLWIMIKRMSGTGFNQAKNFVRLMAQIGESLSSAAEASYKDNQELRDVNTELNELYQLLDSDDIIDDTESSK